MARPNLTLVTEFLLTAFAECPECAFPPFLLFLSIYFVTLLGKVGMIILICVDGWLQPMYLILSHVSFMDICYSPSRLQTMAALLGHGAVLSYTCCAAQFFLFTFFGSIDCYLLAVMAYDRYVAVCQPLFYVTITTRRARLTRGYLPGLLSALVRTVSAFTLSFCGLPPLLKPACRDSYTQAVVTVVFATFVIPACMTVILVSYLCVIVAIVRIPSSGGWAKAFSTCVSHLTAVSLFFGTLIFMYLGDNSGQSSERDRVVSVFYTTVIPMSSPLIYSLRNREVKEAMRKVLSRVKLP
ncbi:LOW QUALITY PROTEIN: olfactory receptor 9Q1-like [Ctenodactylus gundi]